MPAPRGKQLASLQNFWKYIDVLMVVELSFVFSAMLDRIDQYLALARDMAVCRSLRRSCGHHSLSCASWRATNGSQGIIYIKYCAYHEISSPSHLAFSRFPVPITKCHLRHAFQPHDSLRLPRKSHFHTTKHAQNPAPATKSNNIIS